MPTLLQANGAFPSHVLEFDTRRILRYLIDVRRREVCPELTERERQERVWAPEKIAKVFIDFRSEHGRWPASYELHSPLPAYRTVRLHFGTLELAREYSERVA